MTAHNSENMYHIKFSYLLSSKKYLYKALILSSILKQAQLKADTESTEAKEIKQEEIKEEEEK
ncbi:MAG: hypothetical protein WBA07_11615 [Rivularia sp. (in: cyanobacteria)]